MNVINKLSERPEGVERIHFTCNGPILLIHQLPLCVFRDGDTASGSNEDDEGSFIWRCTVCSTGTDWELVDAWSKQGAMRCINEADIVVILGYDQELQNAALKWNLLKD